MTTQRVPWQAKFLALAVIWGSSFLFMMVGLRALEPVQISTLRVLSGGSVLLALAAATGTRLPRERSTWGHLMVSGFLLSTLPFTLFAYGETRVSSALAGIGIRIEDDVRVTETGCDVFTTAPKTVAEIEEVMRHD